MATTVAATSSNEIRRKIHELSRVERAFAEIAQARRDVRSINLSTWSLHHAGRSERASLELLNRIAEIESELLAAEQQIADAAANVKQELFDLIAQAGA